MNSDTVISKTDAMNDTSLSSLYRRMTAGAAGREVDANELVAAIDASDLPVRIAISNMVSETAGAIGPIAGGALAAAAGYSSVFILSMVFLAIGGIIVARFVPEPRRRSS